MRENFQTNFGIFSHIEQDIHVRPYANVDTFIHLKNMYT